MESAGPGLGGSISDLGDGLARATKWASQVPSFIFSPIVLWQNMVTNYLLSLLFQLYSSVALSVAVLTVISRIPLILPN